MTSNDNLTTHLFENFDLILYLLNRRSRPQEILLKKFEIIKKLHLSEKMLSGGVEMSLANQINNYIKKGPY
jgi:hypothetical protein